MNVELLKGKARWFFHVKSKNGKIIMTSQKYFSHSNAKRAALRAADNLKATLKEV